MNLKRKIACKYLKVQYERAKLYLNKQANSSTEDINIICDRVRSVGIAYAQAEYRVFTKKGSWGENGVSKLNNDNSVSFFSSYSEFITELENYIQSVITDN